MSDSKTTVKLPNLNGEEAWFVRVINKHLGLPTTRCALHAMTRMLATEYNTDEERHEAISYSLLEHCANWLSAPELVLEQKYDLTVEQHFLQVYFHLLIADAFDADEQGAMLWLLGQHAIQSFDWRKLQPVIDDLLSTPMTFDVVSLPSECDCGERLRPATKQDTVVVCELCSARYIIEWVH